ncbi:Respiratory supercomplex factor 1, mitochondrial [Tulasnella sp. JGI-2019a]|nr:Respiratory supercomplex factor 1, mitochondrial [Tulasnella sp. JGI-2019a]
MADSTAPAVVAERPRTELDNFIQKGWNKCKQQPFVPAGILLTTFALLGAVREFKRGNSQNMNRFLRGRVLAQGATVAAMLIGSYFYETSNQEKKEQEQKAERDRMMAILDSFPDTTPPSTSDEPVATTTPSARFNVIKNNKEATMDPSTDKPVRKMRYTGDNDRWQEFLNRKDGGSSKPPSDAAPQ